MPFESCCQPYIYGQEQAPTPEALMRSRFSAYSIQAYDYILDTYAQTQRSKLSLNGLRLDAANTSWLKLEVLKAIQQQDKAQVEFCAYYQLTDQKDKQFYSLHELSDFHLENDKWRYSSGVIFEDSGLYIPHRNERCLCFSGKKYKKCCGT
jgi:SEC-C motif-containing protein